MSQAKSHGIVHIRVLRSIVDRVLKLPTASAADDETNSGGGGAAGADSDVAAEDVSRPPTDPAGSARALEPVAARLERLVTRLSYQVRT